MRQAARSVSRTAGREGGAREPESCGRTGSCRRGRRAAGPRATSWWPWRGEGREGQVGRVGRRGLSGVQVRARGISGRLIGPNFGRAQMGFLWESDRSWQCAIAACVTSGTRGRHSTSQPADSLRAPDLVPVRSLSPSTPPTPTPYPHPTAHPTPPHNAFPPCRRQPRAYSSPSSPSPRSLLPPRLGSQPMGWGAWAGSGRSAVRDRRGGRRRQRAGSVARMLARRRCRSRASQLLKASLLIERWSGDFEPARCPAPILLQRLARSSASPHRSMPPLADLAPCLPFPLSAAPWCRHVCPPAPAQVGCPPRRPRRHGPRCHRHRVLLRQCVSAPRRLPPATLWLTLLFPVAPSAATKAASAADPALQLHGTQKLVMPWHDDAKLETGGKVAQFKCASAAVASLRRPFVRSRTEPSSAVVLPDRPLPQRSGRHGGLAASPDRDPYCRASLLPSPPSALLKPQATNHASSEPARLATRST